MFFLLNLLITWDGIEKLWNFQYAHIMFYDFGSVDVKYK